MRYNILLCAAAIVMAAACHRATVTAVTPYANTEIRNAKGDTILAGHCATDMLLQPHYRQWFQQSYNSYAVDSATALQLQPLLAGKTIEVFLGTWCGDSRREVPRLIKLLQVAAFDTSHLHLVFVDNAPGTYKQSPAHEEKGKLIHHVPTIIVYDKKELGRVVETPVVSLEKDLLRIVKEGDYVSKYRLAEHMRRKGLYNSKPLPDKQLSDLATEVKPLAANAGELSVVGFVLNAQQQYAAALNVYRLNILLYPAEPALYGRVAGVYAAMGNREKAKWYYNKVLELKPGDIDAAKQLASLQ
ncbi:TlpA family protein disulfide reductase [Deminuibacter soli]|nr:thioredoxin family protein [Deminuibacter soli]